MAQGHRPSGATIRVVKSFPNEQECGEHLRLMNAASGDIALPCVLESPQEIAMPLAQPRVEAAALVDLLGAYSRLWRMANPRQHVSIGEYHNYVFERAKDTSQIALDDDEARFTLAQAAYLADDLFPSAQAAHLRAAQFGFTHGDAIVSNAVTTQRGVRLIDFSPRPTPPDREIDASKLVFSALGFDLGPRRQLALRRLLTDLLSSTMNPALMRYYLTTHLIRVITREPPKTLARRKFFKEVLNHAITGNQWR